MDKQIIATLGTDNIDSFKQFLLDNGFAHVDENGNTVTKSMTLEELGNVMEKFAAYHRKSSKGVEEPDSLPVIKATTHKPKTVLVERSYAGRTLHHEDKVAQLCDTGGTMITKKKGGKDKKDIDSVAYISFEVIKEWEQFLPKNKRITPYMLEVLTHLITQKAAGNDWTSSQILFRQMNGGTDKKPTKKFCETLYQALSVLACTRIEIDATKEHESGYNSKDFYHGALLATSVRGREIVTINGTVIEDAIHILEQSPLFEYALAKGQVTPIPIGMYSTPSVNSTQENTIIKGYLIRMFADMINPHSPVQPIISYDTLFNYLGVEGKTQQVIWNKKAKIRKTVREILTDWKNGRFIKDFHELTADNNSANNGEKIAKVILALYTRKEFNAIHKNKSLLLNK